MDRKIHRENDRTSEDPSLSGNGALLYVIWFSALPQRAPNQRTEGVSENNDDKVVRQFELLL